MSAALPVWPTTKAIVAYCWRERVVAAKHGAAPLVLLLALDAFGIFSDLDIKEEVWQAIAGILSLFIYAPLLVTWYRTVAFGEDEARQRTAFSFGRLEGSLILTNVLVTITILLALVPLGGVVLLAGGVVGRFSEIGGQAVSVLLAFPAGFAWFMIFTRLSVALAFAAAGRHIGLRETWSVTAPIGLSMTLIHVDLILVAGAIGGVVAIVVLGGLTAAGIPIDGDDVSPWVEMIVSLLSTLFEMFYFLLTTTLFAYVYRRLSSDGAPSSQDPLWPSSPPKAAPSPSR